MPIPRPLNRLLTRREDLVGIGILSLFFVVFFPQALFGGRYLLSGDAFFQDYPLRAIAWDMIRHGTLPLWTPHVLSGYPFLSMAQLGLGYPLTWGYGFLPARVAEQVYVLAPFLLAPIFTYFYLRELRRSFLASLLGALTFGYGGMMASPLANNGLQPNAVMWLPLLLIALERTSSGRVLRPMLLATFAYTMSVLTGYGQGFVYIGILGFLYAIFLVVSGHGIDSSRRLFSISSWRPVLVICGAGILAIGVAAFQILETWQAVEHSVRNELSYEIFTQGSYTLIQLLQAIVQPLFFGVDMYAFVPPLSLGLAIAAVVSYFKQNKDPRILFWLAIALASLVLMLGHNTPVYRLIYQVPILNRFRVPSRHCLEWTFAIATLGSFGWDFVLNAVRKWRDQGAPNDRRRFIASVALIVAALLAGALWWRQIIGLRGVVNVSASAGNTYLFLKLLFALLTTAALWQATAITHERARCRVLMAGVLILSYVEPAALISRTWGGINLPAARFNVVSDASRLLAQFPSTENRVYTRVDLFSEQYEMQPRLDPPNLSALAGLHNVAGYEPLIFERYSRALGGAGLDTVHRFSTYAPDDTLLSERSRVLDILNTKYLVGYSNLATSLEPTSLSNAIVAFQPLGEVVPKETRVFAAPPVVADSLLLVTSLSNSIAEPQASIVAKVRVFREDGTVVERNIAAGVDTAEWAHARPDVRQIIKHNLANVFDSTPVSAEGFSALRFRTELPLGAGTRVKRIEIENITQDARLALYGGALVDTHAQKAAPLTPQYPLKWQPIYDQRQTLILRNERALPRAWLVAEAQAVDSEEALRRIRGESPSAFDPMQTALLEVSPTQLPKVPGGVCASGSNARVVSYDSNWLSIETTAPTATILVLSEIFYPGWVALVDGKEQPIYQTNYLLRGVFLEAGNHKVEMHYRAPMARRGLMISLLTLVTLAILTGFALVRRTNQTDERRS